MIFQLNKKFKSVLLKQDSKYISIASLDVKKAFDSVNHLLLIHKLNNIFHFNVSATKLIQNYLSNRTQYLKCNNILSRSGNINTGVPQGSVLGPLLFLAFINDLTTLENCYTFLLMTVWCTPVEIVQQSLLLN